MSEPQEHPQYRQIRRVARHAMLATLFILALKISVFLLTNSAAVLSDALETIINLVASAVMLYSVWLSNRPADKEHPYGHGKVEFMAAGLEGWMILLAGVVLVAESTRRLMAGVEPNRDHLALGAWLLAGISLLVFVLAMYIWRAGKRYDSLTLRADGKHLLTDAISTVGVLAGLLLVKATGWRWADPVVAMLVAGPIFFTSWHLLWQSVSGLMDRYDPADEKSICAILEDEKKQNTICGYHKVRHRHSGSFHWVEMHLQVNPRMNVAEAHQLASRIETRIEKKMSPCNATAHIEPAATQEPEAKEISPSTA